MDAHEQPQSIRVGAGPDGSLTYLVDLPPEDLPPVGKRDLEHAWYAARHAAIARHWGEVRGFRFMRPDGTHTDLALADRDARCWVGAVDGIARVATPRGLSLCLRLLALIDLLARAAWARPLFTLARDGAELHPALLRAAATARLTAEARFDETGFRVDLSRFAAGYQLESPSPRHAPVQSHTQESSRMRRPALPPVLSMLALSVITLTACSRPIAPAAQTGTDAATQAACRQRAEAVYSTQNRAAIYSPSASVNSPFSGSYQAGSTDRGLSQLYAHQTMIGDCVRANGVADGSPQPAAEAPARR